MVRLRVYWDFGKGYESLLKYLQPELEVDIKGKDMIMVKKEINYQLSNWVKDMKGGFKLRPGDLKGIRSHKWRDKIIGHLDVDEVLKHVFEPVKKVWKRFGKVEVIRDGKGRLITWSKIR